jgi:hypothetical protein
MAGLAGVFSAGRWLPRRSAHSNPSLQWTGHSGVLSYTGGYARLKRGRRLAEASRGTPRPKNCSLITPVASELIAQG